ncbi:hypothetical protein SAMN04487859_111106 [Roseovarius lutimaris]|uniref:Uncharacterized protein n=1 Tax=Roseovarius lutimaris TaxID=1005928 RepID=A0A1I5D0V7_9RHOB|nr:hypothetical protein SAMN04487859_111106 [Roseovarius lutimaris]
MIFRPIRTLVLMGLVFVAGIVFERYQHNQRCAAAEGITQDGLCREIRQ